MKDAVSYRVSDVLDNTYGDRLERAIEWLIVSLLLVMPCAFGAVERWSEEIVLALVAAISICFLVRIAVTRNGRLTWTWAYVPLLIFILIVAAQLVPWPASWLRLISPNTVSRKMDLLQDLPHSERMLSWMPISFYPHATVHDLRLVLAVAVVFVVCAQCISPGGSSRTSAFSYRFSRSRGCRAVVGSRSLWQRQDLLARDQSTRRSPLRPVR